MTPNKKLHTILEQIKNERRGGAPHADYVSRSREVLMMQVRNTTDASAKKPIGVMTRHLFAIFFPMDQMAMAARALGVFVLAAGIVLSGGVATAQLYGDAAPGSIAYGVKTAIERTQLALAPNDEYKMRLLTEFSDRRVDEVARLAEGGVTQHNHIPAVLGKLEVNLVAMQDGLERMRSSDAENVVEVAKLVERKMVVYHNVFRKASVEVPAGVRTQIAYAINLIDDSMVNALSLIVEAHLAGNEGASRTVLASKFESRIRQAEEALVAEESDMPAQKDRRAAIADAKVLIKEEKYQAALIKIEEIAQLTKAVEEEKAAALEAAAAAEEAALEGSSETPTAPSDTPEEQPSESPPAS